MSESKISTSDEFDRLMAEVDASMQESKVPIEGRELHAMRLVGKRLQLEFPICGGPFDYTPISGIYSGSSLAGHISAWVAERYGNRLKVDFSFGYSAVLIRGDAWLLRIPQVFGGFRLVCEKDLNKPFPNLVIYKTGKEDPLTINLLSLVEKLPDGLAESLSVDEQRLLMGQFLESYECHSLIHHRLRNEDLAGIAIADLTSSARRATGRDSEYGMSRWDSLQAAEKFLKLYLTKHSVKFPRTHVLTDLFTLAIQAGLGSPPDGFPELIQCTADVRYEVRPQPLAAVVAAHRAATQVGRVVAKTLANMVIRSN